MPSGDRLKALLSKGYFPKELPAAFTTQDFGDNINAIISEWENGKVFKTKNSPKIRKGNKRGCYNYDLENAEIENISTPKKGYERRNIHITHPVPQALLL